MKHKLFLLSILIILANNSFNQETKKYFTIYSNGYLEAFDRPFHINKGYQAFFPFPSFAYQKEVKRIFYQFDLMPFLLDIREHLEYLQNGNNIEILQAIKQKRFESSLGFILKYWVLMRGKVKINLAFENRLYFVRNFYDSYGFYSHSENNYGLSTSLGCEIEKPINDNFSITFMPLYRINEFYLKRTSNNNPSIIQNLRTLYEFKNTFNPLKYNLRIGVKIKI